MNVLSTLKTKGSGVIGDGKRNLGNAGIVMKHGAKRGAKSTKNFLFGSTANTASGAQELELADARAGIIYFLGNTKVEFTSISMGSIATAVAGDFGVNVGGFKTLAGDAIGNTVGRVPGAKTGWKDVKTTLAKGANNLLDPIKRLLQPLLDKVRKFWMKFAGVAGPAIEALTELFSFVGSTLVGMLATSLASAAPGLGYANDAVGMLMGIRQGVTNSWDLWKMNKAGRGVKLLGGHPQQIVKALQRHYAARIAGGAWGTAKSAGTTAIRATADAAAGAGVIVGLVVSVLSKIVSMIDRIAENVMLRFVTWKAGKEWQLGREQSKLIADHDAFSKWFGGWLVACPVLAALILQSGVAANPMRFVQLMGSNASGMTEGANYVASLKGDAGKFLVQHRAEYGVHFVGKDKLTKNIIVMAYGAKTPAFDA